MAIVQIDPPAEFQLFHPASAGNDEQRTFLTLLSVKQTIPNLETLIHQLGLGARIQDLACFAKTQDEIKSATNLGSLFNQYQSDKSAVHKYNYVYGPILSRCTGSGILEIGIGSNNPAIVSNMGSGHQPGGSLRAFRDFTKSSVYGADVDKDILFDEHLIKCFFVDQTDPSSFDALDVSVPDGLDLVIDDGLHAPNANLATLRYGLRKVRRDGWVIIEDIGEASLPLWQIVYAILSRELECHLLRGPVHYMFVVRKGTRL